MAVGAGRDEGAWGQRRYEIVDEAAQLFAAPVTHATGVPGSVTQWGSATAPCYYYIESKENLLALVHDRVIANVISAGDTALALEGTASKTELGQQELIRIIVSFPDHVWVFLHEFRSLRVKRSRSSAATAARCETETSSRSCKMASTPASSR